VVGGIAVYLVMTVLERMREGRCRSFGSDVECSFEKPRPVTSGPKTVAILDALRRA
jgi:hypothetical protein